MTRERIRETAEREVDELVDRLYSFLVRWHYRYSTAEVEAVHRNVSDRLEKLQMAASDTANLVKTIRSEPTPMEALADCFETPDA